MSHIDFTRVGHFQSILEEKGISTLVKNKDASVGMGEIPYIEIWPELWIVNDGDLDKAKAVIEDVKAALEEKVEAWVCPTCDKEIEEGFGECWNCGTVKET